MTWPGKEDALLVLDHDGSGTIEDGTEVVSPRFQNGFYSSSMDALFSLDTNADNVVDLDDAQFRDLMLWVDQDQDGISQPNELRSLDDEGIVSFNLDASSDGDQVDGKVITEQGSVVFSEGEIGTYVAASFREIGGRTGIEPTENSAIDPDTVVINDDRLSLDGDPDSLLVLNEASTQGDTEDVVNIRHQEDTSLATILTEELGVPAIHDDLSSGGTFYNTNIV